MSSPTVPTEVEDFSPSWMSDALGVEVTAVDVVDAHSGTTGRVKLRLGYGRIAGAAPDTVFCKLAPFEAKQRAFLRHTGIGLMEARFYKTLAADVPVRTPRSWYADWDEAAGSFVMVLEDLDASGCRYPRPADPDVADRARSTVEELARLHAAHWQDPRFDADLAWVPERAGFGSGGGKDAAAAVAAAQFIQMVLDRFADHMPPVFRAVGTLYAARAADIHDLWDQGERTLIHGDPHSGNLFNDQGRTGFFDWAMFSRSPGMRDVAYYCCNSLPTDVRRSIQADLLARYRATLAESGITLEAAKAELQLRLFAVVSWIAASTTAAVGSRWQPSDRALAAMDRTTTALADLDSVGLLGELLA